MMFTIAYFGILLAVSFVGTISVELYKGLKAEE